MTNAHDPADAVLREAGEHLRDHDPDLEHVPPELRELEAELVHVLARDAETGELVRADGFVTLSPRLFGHAHRLNNPQENP